MVSMAVGVPASVHRPREKRGQALQMMILVFGNSSLRHAYPQPAGQKHAPHLLYDAPVEGLSACQALAPGSWRWRFICPVVSWAHGCLIFEQMDEWICSRMDILF